MNFIKKETKSGVPLYILSMPSAHSVASGVFVNVGSRDENWPEEAGLAHAFEHMFSFGTERFPSKKLLSEYVEEVGGRRNAFTSRNGTFFYSQVPFEYFERGIDLLSEQTQHSLVPEEKIAGEMQVVIQELKRSLDNPQATLSNLTHAFLFKDHPIGRRVLGLEDSLLKFSRNNFMSFIERFYFPGNYIFLIVGNVDPNEAVKVFDKYFTTPVTKKRSARIDVPLVEQAEKIFLQKAKINQAHINLAAPVVNASEKEKIAISVFNDMISLGSFSSPLKDEMRNKRGLCYTTYSFFNAGSDLGVLAAYFAVSPEKIEEAAEVAFSVLNNLQTDEKRLLAAKKMKIGGLAMQYEDPSSVIRSAVYDIISYGEPKSYDALKKEIEEITIQDIQAVVEKYFRKDQFRKVMLVPEEN